MSATLSLLKSGPYPGLVALNQYIDILTFTVTPLGNYAALGDAITFQGLSDLLSSSGPPLLVMMWSEKTGGSSGFMYDYVPGNPATNANGKFQVLTSNGAAPNPLLDLGAGAYPAAVLADVIVGFALFVRI